MLRSLTIRHVVLVTALELEFCNEFNVLSGETGAGKSILLDALGLALGSRADTHLIREGCARAEVCAEFCLATQAYAELEQWLDDQAIITNEPGTDEIVLLLRRVIERNGRSKVYINGTPATLGQLRELGSLLVEIHGQHAHQLLLKPAHQRQLLDRHAGLTGLADEVKHQYQQLQALSHALEQARQQAQNRQLEIEQLEWQLSEFDKLAPQTGEWEQLQTEHHRLAHAAQLTESVQSSLHELSEAEHAVIPVLSHLHTRLHHLIDFDPTLGEVTDLIHTAQVQIQEAAHSLHRYAQHLDLDPERLNQVDQRLQALLSFARKHRLPPEQLLDTFHQKRARLEQLVVGQEIETLQQQQTSAEQAYLKTAQKLSKQRQQAAKTLAVAITELIQQLGMAGGYFEISCTPLAQGQAHGLDHIEFLVAGHPGTQPQALAKIASGGELSRISLALMVIISTAHPVPTLIFDEVDAGIGGHIATVVGDLLHRLGQQRQILCVTHLAQIAALGKQHFRVRKQNDAEQTWSEIDVLDAPGRVEEIARMLGGKVTTARQHAQEMLAQMN
jgi:DNA repair protein RecN (Recombination protein N)